MKISSECLSLAGEFAVASELCKNDIYAQLTFGNKKRTDILAMSKRGFVRIEVKAKQGRSWPNCKGIFGDNVFLVFVDYENKKDKDRPDFYVLDSKDWRQAAKKRIKEITQLHPYKKIILNKENVPIAANQKLKSGKSFQGTDIFPTTISAYKEKWIKIKKKQG